MDLHLMRAACSLISILTFASAASAQRVLDWPLRTNAGPEAVTRGVEAAFWNPAAIATGSTRGEVIIADQRAPSAIGVGGFAAAASWRLDARTTVGAGYQRVSIDDIGATSTSPLPDAGETTFSVGEDQIAIGVSHALGANLIAGGGVRYDRSDELGFNESTTSLSAGFIFVPALPLRPVLGASVLTRSGGVRYSGGVEVSSSPGRNFDVRGGWGVRGGENAVAVEQRVGATVTWRTLVAVTAGVATADAGTERSYEPVVGASLRVSRYEIGVLRENLASDFGAAYSFRFKVGLK
ncbi:MAG: hypothetical protein ACT443_01730 [Gemmatimonadota bacterium]